MFSLASNSKLRGIGYKVLNVLRPCNIITLLSVVAASWVMIVMTGVNGQFFFFDAIAHVFVSSIGLFLIVTEVQFGPLKRYFERSWPVFADRAGFFWLAAAMIVLGCDMLANLNKPAFSIKNLGLPMWRLILASGILCLTFGVINFVVTLVFRDGPAGLTARMIRADGNLADGGKLGAGIGSQTYDDYYSASRTGTLSSRHGTGGGGSHYNSNNNGGSKLKEEVVLHETHSMDSNSILDPADAKGQDDSHGTSRFKQRMTMAFKKAPFSLYGGIVNAGSNNNNNSNNNGNSENTGIRKYNISRPIANADLGGGDSYPHVNGSNDYRHDADIESAAAAAATNHPPYPDERTSPLAPDIRRPPTALHPALNHDNHYSVSAMSRF